MSTIWASNQPSSPEQRNEWSFFSLSKVTHWLLNSKPSRLGLQPHQSSRPSNQRQSGRLLPCWNAQEADFCSSMKCKWTREHIWEIRVWTSAEKHLNVTGLSPLTQGTVGRETEESHVRGSLRQYLLKSHLMMICKWYHLCNSLEKKYLPWKNKTKQPYDNNPIWIDQRYHSGRSF